jgi:hypothetical protein
MTTSKTPSMTDTHWMLYRSQDHVGLHRISVPRSALAERPLRWYPSCDGGSSAIHHLGRTKRFSSARTCSRATGSVLVTQDLPRRHSRFDSNSRCCRRLESWCGRYVDATMDAEVYRWLYNLRNEVAMDFAPYGTPTSYIAPI